jgi:hypothetical protein
LLASFCFVLIFGWAYILEGNGEMEMRVGELVIFVTESAKDGTAALTSKIPGH